jgi:glutamate carboxypeptidase
MQHAPAAELTPAMVRSIGRLVQVESPTEDVDACLRVSAMALEVIESWGLATARVESHGGRPVVRWGAELPEVLLLGHLDTVWPVGTLERLPWRESADRMTGPGVFDMKAGVVIGIAALSALGGETHRIGMLLTTDEETGSFASRDLILATCAQARAVLVLEPSAAGALKTTRKGTSWYRIDFHGRAAHAGLDPHLGINALAEAARFIVACVTWANSELETTVTPTLLQAGSTANTVPAHAHLTLDVRAWTAHEQERVDARVRAWQLDHPEAGITISGGIDRAALEPEMSADLFALANEVAHTLGIDPVDQAAVGGASDGNLTAAAGIPTLDGLGAVGDGAHADHEWASISALAPRSELVAGIIERLLRS